MKHLLIIVFGMLGFTSFGQEPNCATIREAISKSRTLTKDEGRKVEVLDNCSTITVVFWDKYIVNDLNYEDGIKSVLREIVGMLIEEDAIPVLEEAGLKRIEVKILGEATPSGYFDLPADRINVDRQRNDRESLNKQIDGSFGEDDVSTGSGSIGGGLGNRGVLALPKPKDNSHNVGTVVIEVCVDHSGNVISAEFTMRGSTTANPSLVRSATNAARKAKFARGEVNKECGTITYDFRIR